MRQAVALLTLKDIIIPLASGAIGVVGAVIGGWATAFFQRRHERKRRTENVLFGVYMMLMDLRGHHFWITSAEVRGQDSDPKIIQRFQDTRWRIADEMRKIDQLPEARDILRAMFSLTYESESRRADMLDQLVDALGEKVNSRYDEVMAEITRENQALMVKDTDEFFHRRKKIEPL